MVAILEMKKYEIDITVGGIQVKGTITVPDEVVQSPLFSFKPPATEKQRVLLQDLGLWRDGMTLEEAKREIGEYYASKNKPKEDFMRKPLPNPFKKPDYIFDSFPENTEPLPWEAPKKKRGRPRKTI